MASPLCGTGIYANDVLCEVIRNLDDLMDAAQIANDNATLALQDLKEESQQEIEDLSAIDYSVDLSAVPKNYTAQTGPQEPDYSGLTPTSPTIPDSDEALISDATITDIFNDTADRLTMVSVKEERDASYQASSMGVGMMSASLAKKLEEATENTNKRIQEVAIKQGISEGEWKREDTKAILGLQLQDFSEEIKSLATYLGAETDRFGERVNKYKADIQAEGERRGWSELQIKSLLEEADKATGFALQKAKAILDITRETSQAVAQLSITLANAIYSAANYHLQGQGQQAINTNISE